MSELIFSTVGKLDMNIKFGNLFLDYDILSCKHITFKYSSVFLTRKNHSNRREFDYKAHKIRAVCIHSGVKKIKSVFCPSRLTIGIEKSEFFIDSGRVLCGWPSLSELQRE